MPSGFCLCSLKAETMKFLGRSIVFVAVLVVLIFMAVMKIIVIEKIIKAVTEIM